MKQKLAYIPLFVAILLPFAAKADAPMDLMIVTPTRMPQKQDETIADATVLEEQDIRNSGVPDVPTLLKSLAGVEVVQTGGLGGQSGIFVRGANSNQVLVLLDGVRIDSASTGSAALEHIMLDSIERIEVVRGNVSGLYGSSAVGGVIQIFTKHGQGTPTFNASAGIGNHDTQRAAVGYSGEVNGNSFNVNIGGVRTNGVPTFNPDLTPNANPNPAGYNNTTINAQVKHAFDDANSLSATIFKTQGKKQFDDQILPNLSITNEHIDMLSITSENQLSQLWHSQVRISQGSDDNQNYSSYPSTFQTRNNQLSWQNNIKLADAKNLMLSIEHIGQSLTSDTITSTSPRNINSFSSGYTAEYGSQQLQFNLRQDRYSDFGLANTGLLGYGYLFADHWRATASISNAFRAPTFNDLYYPGYSNPNLQPERSRNKEIGIHYSASSQRFDVVYFDNHINDLIILDANSIPYNTGQARVNGLELTYLGKLGENQLKLNSTWQNPRDTATGEVLQRRARKFASLAITRSIGAWNTGAEFRYSGARPDKAYDPITYAAIPVELSSYQVLNLTSSYLIDKNFSVSLRIDNLFNRDYMDVYSYNTLGRTAFVGLTYQH